MELPVVRLEPIATAAVVDRLVGVGNRLVGAVDFSWLFALALVVLAWYGSKVVADRLQPQLQERVLRPSVANAVLLLGRAGVVLLAFTPIMGLIGFRPRNILLSVTVLSVVVGAILAPVARSYIGGFFVLLNRPYEIGDLVEIVDLGDNGDELGYVDDVTLRYTRIVTLENDFLVIPNETMRERDVRNISGEDERSRDTIQLCITYESDLETAQSILERAARQTAGVVGGGPDIRVGSSRYPAGPRALIREFGDHGIHLDLRYWVDEPYRQMAIRSAVQANLWKRLTGANADVDVDIAYPHTHHVFDDSSGRVPVTLDLDVGLEDGLRRALEQLPADRRGELLGEQEAD